MGKQSNPPSIAIWRLGVRCGSQTFRYRYLFCKSRRVIKQSYYHLHKNNSLSGGVFSAEVRLKGRHRVLQKTTSRSKNVSRDIIDLATFKLSLDRLNEQNGTVLPNDRPFPTHLTSFVIYRRLVPPESGFLKGDTRRYLEQKGIRVGYFENLTDI